MNKKAVAAIRHLKNMMDCPKVQVKMDEDSKKLKTALRETRDCTVRATAIALDITYAAAHQRLAAMGRKPRKGMHYEEVINRLGLSRRPDLSGGSWKTLAPKLAKGRFVVRVTHHVFAVVDGVVSEYVLPGKRIKMVYEYMVPTVNVILRGDFVTIRDKLGHCRTGIAVARTVVGDWTLRMIGLKSTPGLATNDNIVKVVREIPVARDPDVL